MNKVYAVDFDGTLNTAEYPKLGEPNTELFQFLIKRQQSGDKLYSGHVGREIYYRRQSYTAGQMDWSLMQSMTIFQKIRTNIRATVERSMQIIISTTGTR